MRPAVVRLVDFGMSSAFEGYADFIRKLIWNLNYGISGESEHPAADVESLRVRDSITIAAALSRPALVLHISAHGYAKPEDVGFYGHDDSELRLDQLASELAWLEQGGIVAAGIVADGCDTAKRTFVKAIRDCLSSDCVYIGTRVETYWHESTLFSSLFYAYLLRNRGRGKVPTARVQEAAEAARNSYTAHIGRRCPYEVKQLTPSNQARKSLSV